MTLWYLPEHSDLVYTVESNTSIVNLRLEIGDLHERARVIQFVACDESFEQQQQQHHQPQHRSHVEQQQAASSLPTVAPDVEPLRAHEAAPLSPIVEEDSNVDDDEAREHRDDDDVEFSGLATAEYWLATDLVSAYANDDIDLGIDPAEIVPMLCTGTD